MMIARTNFRIFSRQKFLLTKYCSPKRCLASISFDDCNLPSIPPIQVYTSLLCSKPISYSRGWALQQVLLQQRLDLRRQTENPDDSDQILLLEHSPVYTLGRGADENNLTFLQRDDIVRREALSRKNRGLQSARLSVDKQFVVTQDTFWQAVDNLSNVATPVLSPNDAEIYRIDRGGEVTFHGPGQLVVYPLLDLKRKPMKMDLHWYLRMVEEVIIEVLSEYGIAGERNEINTGVWVGNCKLAAIGVSSSRWITTHGFAINVSPNLEYFDTSIIVPCGIKGKDVTSIQKILMERGESQSQVPSLEDVASTVLAKMLHVLRIGHNTCTAEIN